MTIPFVVDDSEFPIVVVRVPPIMCASTFDAYFERMESIMKRGPIACIVDMRNLTSEGFGVQVRQAFFRRMEARDAGSGVHGKICECFVAPTVSAKKIFASYLWQIQPEGFELYVVTSLDEARAWSLAQLAEKVGRE